MDNAYHWNPKGERKEEEKEKEEKGGREGEGGGEEGREGGGRRGRGRGREGGGREGGRKSKYTCTCTNILMYNFIIAINLSKCKKNKSSHFRMSRSGKGQNAHTNNEVKGLFC